MPSPSYDIDAMPGERIVPPRSCRSSASNTLSQSDSGSDYASVSKYSLQDDHSVLSSSGVEDQYAFEKPLKVTSSYNADQMMRLRQSGRDSLMPKGRPTEIGSAVMKMDDGYQFRSASRLPRQSSTGRMSTSDGLTPLLQAAKTGDLVMLNALVIQPGTDLLRRDPTFGQTALHFAVRGGHLEIVQALLMPQLAGSIVNIADKRRNTALHLAAAKSRRMTKEIAEAGADTNVLNMRNQTPLGVHLLTCTRDDPTMTEILLQHNADPNAPVDKSTALHVALDKNFIQIATRLVRHGARLDLKDESGRMVFDKVDAALLRTLLAKVSHPPVWIPDDVRHKCMECNKRFSMSLRRHHCRYCGRLCCANCSTATLERSQLPFPMKANLSKSEQRKKQRICNPCYDIYLDVQQDNQRRTSMP